MSNLPDFIRELAGSPVDSGHLEMLGKQASRLADTSGLSMTRAVVATLEREKLNSEQTRRVVEFANVDAFNRKFASLDSSEARVVAIDGGPADPAQVLQELGSSSAHQEDSVQQTTDYDTPPVKIAHGSAMLRESFRTRGGVLGDVVRLQSKLAADHSLLVEDVAASSYVMNQALVDLAGHVKTCALQGATGGDLFVAWNSIDPETAKIAYSRTKHLVPEGTKTASRAVNPEHPVVRAFHLFSKHAHAYADSVRACQETETEIIRVGEWLKEKQYVS